jgi:hypothetical protein
LYKFYYTNKNIGAGRGFGNLEISNDIRHGDASRVDTKEYKEKRESFMTFSCFYCLDSRHSVLHIKGKAFKRI